MGQGNYLCYLQIYTNLPVRNKTLPNSWLGCLLNRSKNSQNDKHAVAGYATKIARFRKDPMVYEQEYLWFMKIWIVMVSSRKNKKFLHLYSSLCGLQTWVLDFWQHEDLMDENWLSVTSQLVGMTDSMHPEFEEIS